MRKISRKSAEIKINTTQDTDDRQDFFPISRGNNSKGTHVILLFRKLFRTIITVLQYLYLKKIIYQDPAARNKNISKYTHKNTVRAPFFRRRVQLFFFSTRRTLTTDRTFSELVILLVVKGNAALSDVQGISYVCWACESVFHFGFLYYKPKSTSYSMCSSADSREIV